MDVVISVGDWEHECCGPAVERNEVRAFSCARTTADGGPEKLVEVRHGPFLDEQADVRVHGRVKHPWTGAPLPGGRRFVVVLAVAEGVRGSADR